MCSSVLPLRIHMHNMVGLRIERELTMATELETLIAAARLKEFPSSEREAQRRSFAYGNTHIENSRITRELIDHQAELLRLQAGED